MLEPKFFDLEPEAAFFALLIPIVDVVAWLFII